MKNIKSIFVVFIVLTAFLSACKKDDIKFPQLESVSLSLLPSGKVLFKGNIKSVGKNEIIEYGFRYSSDPSISEISGINLSLGNKPVVGDFSIESDIYLNNIQFQRTLYARAYLKDNRGTVFGDVINITLPAYTLTNVSPSIGKTGDVITITGQFNTADITKVAVRFANVSAKVLTVSATRITVEVPANINNTSSYSNQVNLQVLIANQTIGNYTFFLLPVVTNYFPKSGPIGSTITITGENFNYQSYSNSLRIYLDNIPVDYSLVNSREIRVTVPTNITKSQFKVSYTLNGTLTTLADDFTASAPVITSISPTSGYPGTNITLFGSHLGQYYNAYSIGNVIMSFYSNGSNISATVPHNLTAGEHSVRLRIGPFDVEAPQKFRLLTPSITSFSPTSGSPGEEIELTGNFQSGAYYYVNFGSHQSYSRQATSTKLVVTVPSGVAIGNVKISLVQGSQTYTAPGDFTVRGHSITSFSPTSGVPGQIVTINGTGFNSFYGNNTVRFGSTNAIVLSGTSTSLRVTVPTSVQLGQMKITVVTNGQTVVSENNFTITN